MTRESAVCFWPLAEQNGKKKERNGGAETELDTRPNLSGLGADFGKGI